MPTDTQPSTASAQRHAVVSAADLGDEKVFRMTPKGCVVARALALGLGESIGIDIWTDLADFCFSRMKEDGPAGDVAAIVFDGDGGTVVGMMRQSR